MIWYFLEFKDINPIKYLQWECEYGNWYCHKGKMVFLYQSTFTNDISYGMVNFGGQGTKSISFRLQGHFDTWKKMFDIWSFEIGWF